jgi:DNA-binding response OmpR family regulator
LTPEYPSKGTVLLVEDEASIADLVRLYLERDGFRVVWRTDGPSGLAAVDAERPRLVLLDLMLPGMDGFEVTRALRQRGGRVPVIVVTAREEEADRVLGLELGADDYVTKPFSPRELVARVKAVLRRTEPAPEAGPEPPLHLGSLTVDPARHEVTFEGRPVHLTAREFDLLSYLVRNRGLVLTRDQILERVWGYSFPADTRTVDVHIRQLRSKLGDHAPILTIRGVGYKADDRGVGSGPASGAGGSGTGSSGSGAGEAVGPRGSGTPGARHPGPGGDRDHGAGGG